MGGIDETIIMAIWSFQGQDRRCGVGLCNADPPLSSRALLFFDDAFGGLGNKPGSRIAAALGKCVDQLKHVSGKRDIHRHRSVRVCLDANEDRDAIPVSMGGGSATGL